MIYLISDKIQ